MMPSSRESERKRAREGGRERERDKERKRGSERERERERETRSVMNGALVHAMQRYEFILHVGDAWVFVRRLNDTMLR